LDENFVLIDRIQSILKFLNSKFLNYSNAFMEPLIFYIIIILNIPPEQIPDFYGPNSTAGRNFYQGIRSRVEERISI